MSSPTNPIAAIAAKSLNWSIAISILLILAGIFAILLPPISGLGITLFIGWLLTFSGIMHFIFAWKVHTTKRVLWELLLGILYVFAGFYLIAHPLAGLLSLTLFLAAYLFVEAILEIILAFQLRPHAGWGWTLFDAVVTFILAFMIWRSWPVSSVWAIGTLVGISMLFSGISRLMLSLSAKRLVARIA
jgi:uncharacterized membrane protein HdeD (DUF308 family)